MSDARPLITGSLTLTDFVSWYWLKPELLALCRIFGLSTSGSKPELEEKLRRHLSGSAAQVITKRKRVGVNAECV